MPWHHHFHFSSRKSLRGSHTVLFMAQSGLVPGQLRLAMQESGGWACITPPHLYGGGFSLPQGRVASADGGQLNDLAKMAVTVKGHSSTAATLANAPPSQMAGGCTPLPVRVGP